MFSKEVEQCRRIENIDMVFKRVLLLAFCKFEFLISLWETSLCFMEWNLQLRLTGELYGNLLSSAEAHISRKTPINQYAVLHLIITNQTL